MRNRKYLWAGLTAAVLYNIWPVAYILNPSVLPNGYISTLEATGQPYAKLFILFDIIASLIIMGISYILYLKKDLPKGVIFGYFLFGLTILVAAVMPIAKSCTHTVASCGIGYNSTLDPHDLMSIIGAFAIFYALLIITRRSGARRRNLSRAILLTWCASGLFLALSIVTTFQTLLSQALFLLMCGVAVVYIPLSKDIFKSKKAKST